MIIDNQSSEADLSSETDRARKHRVGIAGAGWVTQYHLPAWRAQAHRAEVVAIADPDGQRRSDRLGAHGIPQGFVTVEEMVAAGDIDILDICAPREAHAPLVRLANGRGLAVICQKPLAVNLDEAEALTADLDAGSPVMVHDNWRFRATYRQIRRWLDAGVAGPLRRVELHYMSSGMIPDAAGARPALVRQPMLAGIARLLVMEVLIHHLDALRFLLGEFDLLDARLDRSNDAIIGEDVASLALRRREDGLPVEVVGNLAAHGEPPQARDQLRIFGADATIALDGYRLTCSGALPHDETFDADRTYQGSYDAAIAHFLDCLETNSPFETSPEDNLRTLALVEAAYDFAAGTKMRYPRPQENRRRP